MKIKICSYTSDPEQRLFELYGTEVQGDQKELEQTVNELKGKGHKVFGWVEEKDTVASVSKKEKNHDNRG
jgi:hypothetical protein